MASKLLLKRAADLLAVVLVLPALCSFWLRARLVGPDRALLASSQALSLLPGLSGQYLRRAFLRRTLAYCHPTAAIEFGTLFSKVGARLGANVYIGPMCHIGLAQIEDDVLVGAAVHIPSGPMTHGIDELATPIREQAGAPEMVRIGSGSWLGSGSIVLADVGRDTVLAAGAVVSRPLPDRVVAAGVPARVIRSRGA